MIQILIGILIITLVVFNFYYFFKIVPTPDRIKNFSLEHERKIAIYGIVIGLAYGIFIRFVAYDEYTNHGKTSETYSFMIYVMSSTFMFVVPFVMGFLTVLISGKNISKNWKYCLTAPATVSSFALGAVFLLAWEGLICLLLFLPVFLFCAMLGGASGGLINQVRKNSNKQLICINLMLLPFLVASYESTIPYKIELRTVKNQIVINSNSQSVWDNIVNVRKILDSEHSFYLSNLIGFPRPIAAELDGNGIGGVRHASFEGGVIFKETITKWVPLKTIAFDIKANTESIPPSSLDKHVIIGGPFFDVLMGQYDIEEVNDHQVILHLKSSHRLSTTFNFYSGFWTDFIMSDIQNYILQIIKKRCEIEA